MMMMKKEKEMEGKWVWKEGNWARKMDNRATKARIKKLEIALKKIQEDEDATPRPVPRARNICTWIETDSEKDVWCCNNEVLRHPETNEMLYLCGYDCTHSAAPYWRVPLSNPRHRATGTTSHNACTYTLVTRWMWRSRTSTARASHITSR